MHEFQEYATFEAAFEAASDTHQSFKGYEKNLPYQKLKRINQPSTRWIVIKNRLYYLYKTPNEGLKLLNEFHPVGMLSNRPFAIVTILDHFGVLSISKHQYRRDARSEYVKHGMTVTTCSI